MTSSRIAIGVLIAAVVTSLTACSGDPYRAYYYEDDHHYRFYELNSGDILLVAPHGQIAKATSVVKNPGYPSIQSPNEPALDLGERQPPVHIDQTSSGPLESTWLPWTDHKDNNAHVVWISGARPDLSALNVSKPKWFPWGNWPLSPPQSEPVVARTKSDLDLASTILPMAGVTTWKSSIEDWDMDRYDVAPTSGSCRPFSISITMNAVHPAPHDPFYKKHSCWNALWDVPASIATDALVGALFVFRGIMFLSGSGF